jgi:hypothetical protein
MDDMSIQGTEYKRKEIGYALTAPRRCGELGGVPPVIVVAKCAI